MITHQVELRHVGNQTRVIVGDFVVIKDTMGRPVWIEGREQAGPNPFFGLSPHVSVYPIESVLSWVKYSEKAVNLASADPLGYERDDDYRWKGFAKQGETEAQAHVRWIREYGHLDFPRGTSVYSHLDRLETLIGRMNKRIADLTCGH